MASLLLHLLNLGQELLFIVNLFVGVVIDNFNKIKDKLGEYALLTPEQAE